MRTGRYRIYRDITNGQYRWLMGPESPLSTEEKQILSHVRRGDPIGLVGMEAHVSERTLSRRLAYIRQCIHDLT